MAAVALVGCGGQAQRDDFTLPPRERTRTGDVRAMEAYGEAQRAVAARDRACRLRFRVGSASVSHEPPAAELLAHFAILRRPASADDRVIDPAMPETEGWRFAIDYARRVQPRDGGLPLWIVPAASTGTVPRRPARCHAAERTELERQMRDEPASRRRAAERILARTQQAELAANASPSLASLYLFARPGERTELVTASPTLDTLLERGFFFGRGPNGAARSGLVGLVPDGVATIDFTFAKGHSRASGVPDSPTYPKVDHLSAKVVDNVVVLTAPRGSADVMYNRQVWRRADGSVIKRLEPAR